MPQEIGIVGLTNAGKSTIFNALTALQVPCEAYPFCTIEPHRGQVAVPDERLEKLAELIQPERVVPAVIEFVDIAGLVKGSHRGEGLGNQFLSEIRTVDAIAQVVRVFEDPRVSHPEGSINPVRDVETVWFELIQKDLETFERRMEKAERRRKVGERDAELEIELGKKVKEKLERFGLLRELEFSPEEQRLLNEIKPLTLKPIFLIANLGEELIEKKTSIYLSALEEYAKREGIRLVKFFGKLEAEIHQLEEGEQEAFLKEMGLVESSLKEVIKTAFEVLDHITFYTAVGGKELHAWTIKRGTTAQKAAGKIHTDFEKGFIKVEVLNYEQFVQAGSEAEARRRGLVRVEGKDYVIEDGELLHFRFQ